MALDTYDNLKAEVLVWIKRTDVRERFDDALLLAETEMLSNPVENLLIREFETRATAPLSITSRFLALPTGFKSMRKLSRILGELEDLRVPLLMRTPGQMPTSDLTGIPTEFTVTSQLEFNRLPQDADTIEMQYIKGFTALSPNNPTNDALTNEPNVYFFGCLAMLNRFAQFESEEAQYRGLFFGAIAGANKKTREGKYGPRPRIIPRGRKP